MCTYIICAHCTCNRSMVARYPLHRKTARYRRVMNTTHVIFQENPNFGHLLSEISDINGPIRTKLHQPVEYILISVWGEFYQNPITLNNFTEKGRNPPIQA